MRQVLKQLLSTDLSRRNYLQRLLGAGGTLALPPAQTLLRAEIDFHFHPQYREETPFESSAIRIRPEVDQFESEREEPWLSAMLDIWAASLLQSPTDMRPVANLLSTTFSGSPWTPSNSKIERDKSTGIEIKILRFEGPALNREPFLAELQKSFRSFSRIFTASFQILEIRHDQANVQSRVRYEIVGGGEGFYREQRCGEWNLQWNQNRKLAGWKSVPEMRSRSFEPFYQDVTQRAFGKCSSYHDQLLHGADYWRTVLDGASGIDVYGHNGLAIGDIDGDGNDDVYVCQPGGLPNRLFRNLGNGIFEDVTESSELGVLENSSCALFADFLNDGRQHLILVRASGPSFYLNDGKGRFRLQPDAFRFATAPQGTFTGAAAADYDRDGRLDVYFCLYTYYEGASQYSYPSPYFAAENGPPNFLMKNQGNGTFRDVTAEAGLDKNNTRFSFCCAWNDYAGDGWPDLYVVNDFGRKNLYKNNHDGTFTDVAAEEGVEDIGAGMSVCWFDGHHDETEDLYVSNMWTAAGERITREESFQAGVPVSIQRMYRKHAMGNSLFRRDGNRFRDVSNASGTSMGRWSWSSDAIDFDHDGYADLYIATGMISGDRLPDLNSYFWRQVVAKSPSTAKSEASYETGWNTINELIRSDYSWSGFERNVLYASNRDGTFIDVSGAVGLDFLEDGRAFVVADFDGDGRQEILIKNRNSPQLRLMKNVFVGLPPSISFKLQGTKSNRDGIGATVTLQTSEGKQIKTLQAGSGFLSQNTKTISFGLGRSQGHISAVIKWPSGEIQLVDELRPNTSVSLVEGSPSVRTQPYKSYSSVVDANLYTNDPRVFRTESWLLVPLKVPELEATRKIKGRGALLTFQALTNDSHSEWSGGSMQHLVIDVRDPNHAELCAVYNLLFRSIFDRHRDLPLPTSFLIDEGGKILKIYQGEVTRTSVEEDHQNRPKGDSERLKKALPFVGVLDARAFVRNYLSLGSTLFQHGYAEASEDFFQSALTDDPASAEANYGLGSVYLKRQENDKAKQFFSRVTKLKEHYPDTIANAWNNLGLIAARENDTAAAVDSFEKAVGLSPDLFVAVQNLGNAYRQQQRWSESQSLLQRAVGLKPEDAEANYSLGMVFAQLDESERAYSYLQKALTVRPDYPEALNNLGVLYLRTHRRNDAVASFQKCIRVAPGFSQAYLNLARVYAVEGDVEKARSVLRNLLVEKPDDGAAKRALEGLR